MRRSTRIAPFSRVALFTALATLGSLALAPAAHAADPAPTAAPAPPSAAAPSSAAKSAVASPGSGSPAPTTVKAATAPDKKTKDAARKAYSDGEKAYAAGDYAAAYTAYTRANELIPSPHAAYWAAKSLEQSGKPEAAIAGYDALLADPGSSKIGEEKLNDARTRLATLRAGQVGEVMISSPAPGAVLTVDGAPQAGPLPLVVKLAPGTHKLTLTAPGFEAKDLDIQVQAGTRVEQVLEMQPHVAPPPPPPPVPEIAPAPPPPPPPEKHSKLPAYVTLGIATGGAVVGTIFGIKALQAKSDFDKTPTTGLADDTERNALIADMAFGVAVTLGVTGIVLLTSGDDVVDSSPKAAKLHTPPKSSFRLLPYVGRESGGASARLTF